MRLTPSRRLCRLALPVLATCTLAGGMPSPASAASQPGVDAQRATTLRLINAERTARGLGALRLDARLSRAALGHSQDMVAHGYFAHDSRSGARFTTRIAASGWMDGRRRWSVGENLAWGRGRRATVRSIVAAWMASPDHRRNILSAGFRAVGIGIARGVPFADGAGATYTTDFGS